VKRLQRLRRTAALRDLVAEVGFGRGQLVQPVFAIEGITSAEPVPGLGEGVRQPLATLGAQLERDLEAGVRQFLLFGVGAQRTDSGAGHEFTLAAIAEARRHLGAESTLWVDTCLCSITTTGHCHLHAADGHADLERTLDTLARHAVDYAAAGAQGIAPSDMNDGRTAALRAALDAASHGLIPIMSYSSKFASHLYGPFRLAADSTPRHGDRRSYQLDVRSRRAAIDASLRCAEEGADLLMVKPAMSSLDLLAPISERSGKPVGAYQVSGEYAGLALLAREGLVDFEAALLESWLVLRRAGAAFIVTYGARYADRLGLA
jgi:porphobilinogen synthase